MKNLLKGAFVFAASMIAVGAVADTVLEKKWEPTVPDNSKYGQYVVEACVGPNETAWLSVYVYNDRTERIRDLIGIQGDIFLPDGMDMVPAEIEDYDDNGDPFTVVNEEEFQWRKGPRFRNSHFVENKLREDNDRQYDYSAEPADVYHDPYNLYGRRHFRFLNRDNNNSLFLNPGGVSAGITFEFLVQTTADYAGGMCYVGNNVFSGHGVTKLDVGTDQERDTILGVRAPIMGVMLYAPTALADIVENGADGTTFYVGDDLAVVEGSEAAGAVYATDGKGNWMKIATDDYATLASMSSIAGRTLKAQLSGSALNPVLTLVGEPEAASNDVAYEIEEIDMAHHISMKPNQVVKVSGYYTEEDGVGVLRAYSGEEGGMGQSLTIDNSQLGASFDWQVGAYYTLPAAAVELKEAWANNVSADDDIASQNYVIYPLQTPAIATAVNDLRVADSKVSVNGNTISVEGAKSVAIFNAAGARVSNAASSQVAPGVYVVVADGQASKVVVK